MQNKQIKATSVWLRQGLGEAWPAFQLQTNLLSCHTAFATQVINSGSAFPPATWPAMRRAGDTRGGTAAARDRAHISQIQQAAQAQTSPVCPLQWSSAWPGGQGQGKSSSDSTHGL